MKLANPLHYPTAIFLGAIALVIGVRMGNLPKILMLPLAGAIAFVGASLREAQKPKNAALKREISNLKQQSKSLAEQATNLRRESESLLINASQIELLSTIQFVCDRAQELPAKIEEITNKLQEENSLLSPSDIQRQLAEVTARQSKSSGVAKQQLEQLVTSLERNLELARQGEDTRQAQVYSLKFQQQNPQIKLDLKFQGSQDIVNRYIDRKNDFEPTILIPAEGEILQELSDRLSAQENSDPFYETPRPIAKTRLVGIAWQERGKVLFPNGRFSWQELTQAMKQSNWNKIGGKSNWGSFDLAIADPTRSNSGQLTLDLWAKSLDRELNSPEVQALFSLIKRSVYQPARSTDILLQEYISRGANDADVATVYESIALYRWQQAQTSQGLPYQIYYLNPTIETVATAAIARRNVDRSTAKAAQEFLDFITQPQQQKVFVRYGFRPVIGKIDLKAVANSPWSQNIPGSEINPPGTILPPPNNPTRREIQRMWQRVN